MNLLINQIELIYFIVSICILIGLFANNFSKKIGIPTLVIFLLVGMLAGTDGIGGIGFANPHIAQVIGNTALIFILFIGGLDTSEEDFKGVMKSGLSLSTLGVVISTFSIATFVYYVFNLDFWTGVLIGGILSATDAVVAFSILRSRDVRVKEKIRNIIEFESATNDPVVIFLVLITLQAISGPFDGYQSFFKTLIFQFAVGTFMGILAGKFLNTLFNKIKFTNENFYFISSISLVLGLYGSTQMLGGSGFLAVYLAGIYLAKKNFPRKKSIIIFHDTLAWLIQVVMFITLGLFVFPKNLIDNLIPGLILAAASLFIARPLSVLVSLARSKFTLREKSLISWGGFRGATPIILALYPLTFEIPKAEYIFNIIFVAAFISMLVQAPTFAFFSKILKLDSKSGFRPRFPIGFTVTQKLKNHLKELEVGEGSNFIGKNLVQLNFPQSSRIIIIQRKQDVIAPRGTTVIEKKDILLILASEYDFATIKSLH